MPSPVLTELENEIRNTIGVQESAIVFITGVPALIESAVQQALANGATEGELAPFDVLADDLRAKSQALADAIAANP